ncbi:122_t:CDS:10, partial [Cetraspora pellucida]
QYQEGIINKEKKSILSESLKVVDLAEQVFGANHARSRLANEINEWHPISGKVNENIRQAYVEHGHGGCWNAPNYHINNVICIDMKECYPASMRGQGECTPWFNRFGHPTHYLVRVVINRELPEDDITGFAQVRSFKFASNIHSAIPVWYGKYFACRSEEGCGKEKGWAPIVLLQYLLEVDEGELDFLIKDCTNAGTFAEREKCLLRFILTYYEGHQPQYTHLRALMLAYAHINLLEMLRRFDPNEVVRIATDSIYVRKEALYKIENIPAFFKQVENRHWESIKNIPESTASSIYDPITRCWKSYLNGGGDSGKTTHAIRIFKNINMVVFTHTNALAKDFQEKCDVKAQTWHSFFRWNGVEEWTPECMGKKKFPRVHADYYEEVLTDYHTKCPKLRELKKAMRILPTIEKWKHFKKKWTPSDRILSAHCLSRRIASQKCLELHHIKYPDLPVPLIYRPRDGCKQNCLVPIPGSSEKQELVKNNINLGYAMTVHTSQGMTLEAPQRVWVIDEHLAWNNLIYLAVGCVEYLNQLVRIEGPPLPPEIEEAKNKKAIERSLRPFISEKLVGYMDQDKKKDCEFNLSDWNDARDLDQWTADRIDNKLGHIEGNVRLICLEYMVKQFNDSVMDFYMKVKASTSDSEKQVREIFINGLSPENYLEAEKFESGILLNELVGRLWVLESERKAKYIKLKAEQRRTYQKIPKRAELLKALGINILKGHSNSLASNITIPELENCHECNEEILLNPPKAFTTLVCDHILHHDCLEKSNRDKQKTCPICFVDNEGMASAEVQNVDMSEAVEDEGEETSNLTGAVSKLSVDSSKAIPRNETKSMEPDKVQGLIKELSIPSKPIDDNDRGNKSKESKPINLLQLYYNANRAEKHVTRAYQEEIRCWYLFAKKFEKRVKEIKNDNSRYNDQQARGLVYGKVATNLPGFTRDNLRKKTAKARNIYKLFGESYDPDTKKIVKGIGIEKIERIRTYKDFLEEYDDKNDLSEKIGIYLRSLEVIADNEEGQRSKRAKELLLKYRERVVLRSRLKADLNNRPDRQKARNLNNGRISGNPSISINNSTVSGNVQGIVSKRKVISDALGQKNIQTKKQRLPYVEQNIENEDVKKGLPLFFESSQLLSLQEMISETIKSSEGLDIKLLKWQQHTLQQLSSGICHPSKQNIHNILGASSIFYFQQKNEQGYSDFLTSDESLAIWSRVTSKFKKLSIPEEIIEFVKKQKKSFQQDSLETIERIDVESKASKLRRGYGRCPDYKLNNKDGTRTGVLAEVTSPKRKGDEPKIYWDIYRGAINAKDEIDQDIKQNEICPDEAKRIIIFIVGFKMSVCILGLLSPGIYILAEVDSLIIPKTDNALDILGDRICTTPPQTNYLTWLRPTATTPDKADN